MSYNGSTCTVTKNRYGISGCTRISLGRYGVSLSITMPDTNYQPICGVRGNGNTLWWPAGAAGSTSNTTTGFYLAIVALTGSTMVSADPDVLDCVVY
jgi:hypothetical protein